jgi:uncharacterized protein (DUF1810 family)
MDALVDGALSLANYNDQDKDQLVLLRHEIVSSVQPLHEIVPHTATPGAGKSTALRMAMAALSGTSSILPDNMLTCTYHGGEDKVSKVVAKSRMVIFFELDLDKRDVNMLTFKNITENDFVRVEEFYVQVFLFFRHSY